MEIFRISKLLVRILSGPYLGSKVHFIVKRVFLVKNSDKNYLGQKYEKFKGDINDITTQKSMLKLMKH